jgi:DNA-directed RNA polymerase specialized sigma24 family protein
MHMLLGLCLPREWLRSRSRRDVGRIRGNLRAIKLFSTVAGQPEDLKMSTRPGEELETLSPKKRAQKYNGFALRPGDEELLDQLSPQQQKILLSEGPYNDLAAALGVAVGTLKSRLHRARAALSALRESSAQQRPLRDDSSVH